MTESVVTVASKGRITLPVAVRRRLGINTGDRVAFMVDGEGRVRLRRIDPTLESVRGIIKTPPGLVTDDFDDLIEEAMNDHADWVMRRMREGFE